MKIQSIITILLLITSVFLAGCSSSDITGGAVFEPGVSVLDKVKMTGELKIGYGGYPPYLKIDPATKEKSGFSVDLVEAIIKNWNRDVEIVWVETTWDRFLLDLQNEKFDMIAEPIFYTVPRAAEIDYSRPYSYFGYAVALVDIDEDRFDDIKDLNNPSITIAVAEGVASKDFAVKNLPKAKLITIPGGKVEVALQQVVFDKADAALADVPTIQRYIELHDGVKALFMDNPPALTPAGFVFRQGDYKWSQFLDTSISFLETSGEIQSISEKYGVPYYEVPIQRK